MIYEEKTVCDLEQVKSLMFQHVDTFPLHFEAYFYNSTEYDYVVC